MMDIDTKVIEVKDPVCGMKIDKRTAKFKSEYEGKTYYFCSLSCKKKFDENPEKVHLVS
ncbi:YHS domain-containing protein [Methanohalophilus levihalophilus]|uniref:YHS domain-containing protein n=1 Tax=Methanohalophilus levihalophilus TaxID=1431282 RepID=UPI001AE9C907|nr:YHS domain-containing protein [Methanohalophilus levihalophilus]MBP2030808.1 YHS domain-containing protein [Methanohalophilus levihalophilus]